MEIEEIKPFELRRASFTASAPTRVSIDAEASLERDAPESPLATAAWILRREDRLPIWKFVVDDHVNRDGTRVSRTDELAIQPGTYDAYFASLGNDVDATRMHSLGGWIHAIERFFGERQDWEDDADRWHLRVSSSEGQPTIVRVDVAPEPPEGRGVVWSTAPMHNRSSGRKVFEVIEPVDLRIYAIGELGEEAMDFGWIQNLSTDERVWELTRANSEYAGGFEHNRRFSGTVHLTPGIYVASFETDADHAPDHWRANPPFDPAGWGITLSTDPARTDIVRSFDPWEARTPILDLTHVGSARHEQIPFTVQQSLNVIVDAVGEITRDEAYDFGWIENASGEHIWEMKYASTSFAGGRSSNREALEILRLQPGDYVAHFQTDDSHAYDDWYGDKPARPEAWGLALFPLDRTLPDGAVAVMDRVSGVPAPPPPPGTITLPNLPSLSDLPSLGDLKRFIAVQINGVGNDANLEEPLRLETSKRIVVVAQGEIVPEDRFDYAWIERADDGDTVWSMTWQNTMPAGGDVRNRVFSGSIELPAGEYVVRYKSDPSHAFGDFGKIPPNDPSAWGVSVVVPPEAPDIAAPEP